MVGTVLSSFLGYGIRAAVACLVISPGMLLCGQDAASGEAGGARRSLAVTYPERTTVEVKFQGTYRLPEAKGKATVRRRRGAAEIDVRLERMKPALFGGDYNTYVLWTVSPEGVVINAGEFILRGHKSRLETSTPLSAFGMFVTAEPHFLIASPSGFVVLQNSSASLIAGKRIDTSVVSYQGFEGQYEFDHETLADVREGRGEYRVERQQAMTAMSLAEKAQARRYAPQELAKAQQELDTMLEAFGAGIEERRLALLARTVVRAAVEARARAEERVDQAARDAQAREIADLTVAKAEADQAAAEAKEQAELARREREQALEAKAEAQEAARLAQIEQQQAQQMMRRAEVEAERLARLKAEAERYAAAARARLKNALSKVVETSETARGVVVNLPDILFATGRSRLLAKAREVLSRLTGILLVMPDFTLSIEGHTDSTGTTVLNQRLSERRAASVYEYLEQAGIAAEKMAAVGFGESQPRADNRTAAGRSRNRRVEIVIAESGDSPL